MKMVKVILTDGTIREMTRDEFKAMSLEGMMKEFNGKAVLDVRFYEESGK